MGGEKKYVWKFIVIALCDVRMHIFLRSHVFRLDLGKNINFLAEYSNILDLFLVAQSS